MLGEYITEGEQETIDLATGMGGTLKAGSVIAFTGDLGAGKTAFVRGLARGLNCPDRVSSPTFTIVNEYEGGRLPLFHFDLYRLDGEDALFELGWEDYLTRAGVCAVEWSERLGGALEPGAIRVDMRQGAAPNQRLISITRHGGGLGEEGT